MPRQLTQLPADTTTLARKVAALERQVTELRAARRLSSATAGLIQTATAGARVEVSGTDQAVSVYASDGTTPLARLAADADGQGGGLWTRGLQDPHNMAASLKSGQLLFRPVDDGLVAVPASMSYDTDAYQYSDLTLTSGAVNPSDHRALLILESLFDGSAHVSVQGERSAPCTFDVLGIFTASNIACGSVTITPSAAGAPTSVNVTGLALQGSSYFAVATPATAVPGSQVTGVGVTNLTASGMTVWLTRTNTTTTTVNWMVIGT
ncbi:MULTISPECIES: hypothetical protein [Streptomyces]|uniref:hypothetical protein n=1 Tax=Streptomyces TaxID=1883 RepID=UPI003403A607